MKFALLASGSRGNCCVIEDEHLLLMIDCGTTAHYLRSAMAEIGITPQGLDALLITHDHTDHISQIKMFTENRILSPVPLSVETERVVPGQAFQLQHMTVTPIALSHDTEVTVGYVMETWQEKLVYITDTGYIRDACLPLLKGADYIILESNHDLEMLMHTRRPAYVKHRIASDSGHLCNEDCAAILSRIVTPRTKEIVLAHISQEANTPERALQVTRDVLLGECRHMLSRNLRVTAAHQYEIIRGGTWNEKVDSGSTCWIAGMERVADLADRQ